MPEDAQNIGLLATIFRQIRFPVFFLHFGVQNFNQKLQYVYLFFIIYLHFQNLPLTILIFEQTKSEINSGERFVFRLSFLTEERIQL